MVGPCSFCINCHLKDAIDVDMHRTAPNAGSEANLAGSMLYQPFVVVYGATMLLIMRVMRGLSIAERCAHAS